MSSKEPLDLARRIASRWIAEHRHAWLIYHTNITHYGLLLLSRLTGEQQWLGHVRESYRDYARSAAEELYRADFHMHTFGIAETALYLDTRDEAILEILRRHDRMLWQEQHRADDGLFTHSDRNVVFVDCLAGIIPFLARMGQLAEEQKYFDEAAHQICGFRFRLINRRTGLFNQGEGVQIFPHWPSGTRGQTEGAWARGNGWMMLSIAELLEHLPPQHHRFLEISGYLSSFAATLRRYQGKDGMWRQIIDRPDGYPETSGTGLILFGIARGIRRGWLGPEYADVADLAFRGLGDTVDQTGSIRGTCIGTPFQRSEDAYANLPAPLDDPHGHGPLILACCEYEAMQRARRRGGP